MKRGIRFAINGYVSVEEFEITTTHMASLNRRMERAIVSDLRNGWTIEIATPNRHPWKGFIPFYEGETVKEQSGSAKAF